MRISWLSLLLLVAVDSCSVEPDSPVGASRLAASPTPVPPEPTGELSSIFRELGDVALWNGLSADNVRQRNVPARGAELDVILADVHIEPGGWSGLIFSGLVGMDWSNLELLSALVRWESLNDLDGFALVLEDTGGRRWGWYPNVDKFEQDNAGWQEWTLSREEAEQQEQGFQWGEVAEVHVSALAHPGALPSANQVELGWLRGLEWSGPTPVPTPTPSPTPMPDRGSLVEMEIEPAFPGLTLPLIVRMAYPDDGTDRLFLALQEGRIVSLSNDPGVTLAATFLDIRGKVDAEPFEMGLLGLEFDPGYRDNGHFYVYYTASPPRRSVVSRFTVSPGAPNTADPDSEVVILEVAQPHRNHNGGQLLFGPDGYLYISLGDGGDGGPQFNSQNRSNLLGSTLRIDLSSLGSSGTYSVPVDNPFVGLDPLVREEIWAYGFRNPWRFTFDRATGDMWVGDVGQDDFEEVDIVKRGLNYGWNLMEGSHCYKAVRCNREELEPTVIEYTHRQGAAIIGGYVYRGSSLPSLQGAYVYGDVGSGKVWALRYDGVRVTEHLELADVGRGISAFGEDRSGELYILTFEGFENLQGRIYRMKPR